MRNFHGQGYIKDKKFILAFVITLICSFICGIVLYKIVTINPYLRDFAEEYVFNVFNFRNGTLLLTHILSALVNLYIVFAICYFTKFKYLILILIFLRGLFFGVYTVILIGVSAFGGAVVAVFVFIPSTLVALALLLIIAESCKCFFKKYALFVPLVLALCDSLVYMLLINILFRLVIIIV